MSDDGQAFPWGLKPGGTPEEATPVRPVTPVSPVDQGHFVAVPDPHALPQQQSDPSQQQGWSVPGQATPSFGQSPAGLDVAATPLPSGQPAAGAAPPPAALAPAALPAAALPPVQPGAAAVFPPTWPAVTPDSSSSPHVAPEQPPAAEHSSPTQPVAAAHFPSEPLATPAGGNLNALENLFGEERFVEYQPGLDLGESPFQSPAVAPAGVATDLVAQDSGTRAPLPKLQRTLIWVAVALVGVLALGGLFLLGKTIAPSFAAAPVVEAAPSAAPEAVLEILGPLVAGTYGWDDLLGTECVEPWGSAWDQEFTVVDCGEPHAAQLVYRGTFEDSALAAYPGVDELQSRMNLLCASRDNIDYSAAKKYDDIQLSASFAASESDWVEGNHDYFCFVSRSSGEQLTTNVAMPDRPAPVVPVVVEPEP